MGRFILVGACFLSLTQAVTAQVQYNIRTTWFGCQRITEIAAVEPLAAPKQVGEVKGQVDPKQVTMSAREWRGGILFKDGDGRVWRLVQGSALLHNPLQLTGTVSNGPDGRVLFLTSGGVLFVRIEQ